MSKLVGRWVTMRRREFTIIFLGVVSFVWASVVSGQEKIDFNLQIRPILNAHCISCHGPDEADRQADLRLDTFSGATESAIVPGDAESSEVLDRVLSEDEDYRMPPPEHGEGLTETEIMLLRSWIDSGAEYQVHWAFAPIEAASLPSLPTSTSASGPRVESPIDAFILKKLQSKGLSQNRQSNPRELVRRLSLDLTGLPPQAHQPYVQLAVENYLLNNTQSNYELLVDRLLESNAYAEHWAAVWMDLARYADTCGYSGDEQRDIWPWRDWLIRSLMENKSYKDMSTEMLAGDLLPDPSPDQILATAFHRNTLTNNEGGTDDEEFRMIAVKDRLSTTVNAWMGLTVRCAECHTHKYDPISQREYYQLLDFFNHTKDSDKQDERPKLAVTPSRDPMDAERLGRRIAELERMELETPKVWKTRVPVKMESKNGTVLQVQSDQSILAKGKLPHQDEYAFTFTATSDETITGLKLEAIPHVLHNGKVGRAGEGGFILTQIRFAELAGDGETVKAWKAATASFHQPNRHPSLAIRPEVKSRQPEGWAVKHPVDGYGARQEAIFELEEPFRPAAGTQYKIYLLFDSKWIRLNMGCVRFSVCEQDDPVAKYDSKSLDPVRRELALLKESMNTKIRVPVMLERDTKRETFVHTRGNFRNPGEKVAATFPKAFDFGGEFPRNRLGLARWLFDERNPLTARVAVNRFWARLMGLGLVETEEDFGTQGSVPTHPELLDYLALQFRESEWDMKELLKSIVTSATYQQNQRADQKTLELDPKNRLFARGPRVRLSAEVVRDQALAVSGLLSTKMFGKPVYPPNPIKRVVNAFTGGSSWKESQGADRYRKAIYTFLKRSAPHPLFETFDMATRDVCSMRRIRTNTPLQSFMTLNDVTFIEAARALATTMMKSERAEISQRIEVGIQQALFTSATEKQLVVLADVYQKGRQKFSKDVVSAAQFAGVSGVDENAATKTREEVIDLAAMTLVANVILNLDSFLNN